MEKNFRHIEDGFLTPEECQGFIKMAEELGFEEAKIQTRGKGEVMDKEIRDNDRVIHENQSLADQLWEMVKPLVPEEVDEYKAVGLNEKFRFYRYQDGQQFKAHMDGAFKRNEQEHSKITAIIYLNENFERGTTMFVSPYETIEPKEGRLLLFAHRQLHTGQPVPEGTKYVLRTDVMYRREMTEEEIVAEAAKEPEEVYLGEMNELFGELTQEESSVKLKLLATQWSGKGYMIATGKISENKMNELWAIKKPINSENGE